METQGQGESLTNLAGAPGMSGAPDMPPPVEVWICDLDRFAANRKDGASTPLSSQERERASRFRFDIHRERYVATRIVLRTLMGAYIGIDPGEVRFSIEPGGKPRLDPEAHAMAGHFNLSHCGNMAVFCVSGDREVGIDLENANRDIDTAGVAKVAFSDRELRQHPVFSGPDGRDAFFRHWTLREAMFKAMGIGLPSDRNAFSVLPVDPHEWQIESPNETVLQPWRACAVDLPAPWICSIAANGPSSISVRIFEPEEASASAVTVSGLHPSQFKDGTRPDGTRIAPTVQGHAQA
jgi:4'-phosphopantetheinyl transferase